ncbi:hypothetical protein AB0C10_36460 [Microbispora amethystogenes]|uniref:hypothetical protein n=1 Tax=Microbispora amethystogenes TaxID=1427754 RepID=UPI0033D9C0F6
MTAWQDLKDGATRPCDSVPVCLRGDLAAAYAELDRRLAEAVQAPDDSMAAGTEALQIAEEMAALRERMTGHTYRFTFQALPRRAYRDLVDDNPPRENHPEDAAYGVNMATFPVELIAASCVAITPVSDPEPDVPPDAKPVMTAADVEDMTDQLSDGQVHSMFSCTFRLNRSGVDLPKSLTASELVAMHAPRSKPPEPGA